MERDWFEDHQGELRGSVTSWLGGKFFQCSQTTEQRLKLWRFAGSGRVAAEEHGAWLERLQAERPELFAEKEREEHEQELPPYSGGATGWGHSSGW